jgi:ADP-ribosylglycohydrolase/8-oxo-dGTP pyrophosphatase MutT (NUDIX family)
MTAQHLHPKTNDHGQPVTIRHPHQPQTDGLRDGGALVTITPGLKLDGGGLHGIPFRPWSPPRTDSEWVHVDGQAELAEPAFTVTAKGLQPASGAVVVEPDNRLWLVAPTNQFGGYQATFPKGRCPTDGRWSPQVTAIREVWQESGLKVRIVEHLLDLDRSTTRTRYYLAVREGGDPADMGWESQAVHLATFEQAQGLLNTPYDQAVLAAAQQRWTANGRSWPLAWWSGRGHVGRSLVPQRDDPLFERILGCLLGGAVGDALGAPVEFMSRAEIERRFGPQGLVDYAPAYGGIGRVTDDTQMALFTAEGLLRTWVRGRMRGLASYPDVVRYAYLRWLHTQGETGGQGMEWALAHPGWLYRHPALHARRAPGHTCLAALRSEEVARNDSKGCGGVMRVAPVGLYTARIPHHSVRSAFDLGGELAALTHGHPTGQLAAGAFAALIHVIVRGGALDQALEEVCALLPRHPQHEETLAALQRARQLARAGEAPTRAIPLLGQGWVAEEALAIAVFCALVADGFEEGVRLAIHHDGDSDSTGAIAGNLLGAMGGARSIPERWLEPLELREVIVAMAQDLVEFPDWPIGEYVPLSPAMAHILTRYPGC